MEVRREFRKWFFDELFCLTVAWGIWPPTLFLSISCLTFCLSISQKGTGPVNAKVESVRANSSTFSFPWWPVCPGAQASVTLQWLPSAFRTLVNLCEANAFKVAWLSEKIAIWRFCLVCLFSSVHRCIAATSAWNTVLSFLRLISSITAICIYRPWLLSISRSHLYTSMILPSQGSQFSYCT